MIGEPDTFYCSKHTDTEAFVFCEECSKIQGCSGYWCKSCDEEFHKFFPTHQREGPKPFERSTCDKHPGHSTEEIFCLKTRTFHCAICGYEDHIEADTIPIAAKKEMESVEKEYSQIKENVNTLSNHRNDALFELNDNERNPKNLERQFQEAKDNIQEAFKQLREAIDKREEAILGDLEKTFNFKIEKLRKRISELDDAIESGNKVIQSYDALMKTKKGERFLKGVTIMKKEVEKEIQLLSNFDFDPVIHNTSEFMTKERDSLIERINNFGKITEGTNIPAPKNIKVENTPKNSVRLRWDPVKLDKINLSISYKVVMKSITNGSESEWTECYNGSYEYHHCDSLRASTNYVFRIYTICDGIKSVSYSTCTFRTVNPLS